MTSSQKRLIESLGSRISKAKAIELSFEIAGDTTFSAEVIDLLKTGNSKEVYNILWALRSLQPSELQRFKSLPQIILELFRKFPFEEGILRDGVGLLQILDISEDFQGEVFDLCFGFLQDNSKPIAVKAFSMTVCYNLAKKHPELLKELEIQIKDLLLIQGHIFPAIFSRGNAILQRINRHLRR
jgi:hypothetical protein